MRFLRLFFCCIVLTGSVYAQQPKCKVLSLGAAYIADSTGEVLVGSFSTALRATLHIEGIAFATSVSIGVGTTPLSPDGITTIFEVIKDNRSFFLVEQNQRYPVDAGMVKVLLPASDKKEDYVGHYLIVQVTDKEGKISAPVSVEISY